MVAVAVMMLEKLFGPVTVMLGVVPVGAPVMVTVSEPVEGGGGGQEVNVAARERSNIKIEADNFIKSSVSR
jgi:hypothetical protein